LSANQQERRIRTMVCDLGNPLCKKK
jgi:hypothetical protein